MTRSVNRKTGEITEQTAAMVMNLASLSEDKIKKLRKICTALGKYGEHVWFGVGGVRCDELGKVLG